MKENALSSRSDELIQTARHFLDTNNPSIWVAGIGMGTIAVGYAAIKAIVKLSENA